MYSPEGQFITNNSLFILAESNSSLLHSKIGIIQSQYLPYIHTLGEFKYEQVVFTADKIEGKYVKKCLGYMLSEWHGISSTRCPDPK